MTLEQANRPHGARPVQVLYVDLDSTVRKGFDELGRWVNGPADVEVFPEAVARLWEFKSQGWRIIAVTNQGGVALGHMTRAVMIAALEETHRQCHKVFDMVVACIHHPDADDPEMAVCWCRKPRAGLAIDGALTLGARHPDEHYPPHLALVVGDREEDRGLAQAINAKFLDAVIWRATPFPDGYNNEIEIEIRRPE